MYHEQFRDYEYPKMMFNWPYFYPEWHCLRDATHHKKRFERR